MENLSSQRGAIFLQLSESADTPDLSAAYRAGVLVHHQLGQGGLVWRGIGDHLATDPGSTVPVELFVYGRDDSLERGGPKRYFKSLRRINRPHRQYRTRVAAEPGYQQRQLHLALYARFGEFLAELHLEECDLRQYLQ